VIDWKAESANVCLLKTNVSNNDILALAQNHGIIGIDAPFGWPIPFVQFLGQVHAPIESRRPLVSIEVKPLCWRLTDLRVWEEVGKVPLSVAADKIAIPAMRCAVILDTLGVEDRSGDGRVFEVYPAAALMAWGFAAAEIKGYKRSPDILTHLFGRVLQQCPLTLSDADRALASLNHDAFDALIASLVTRAAVCGLTRRPDADELERAKVEGWIALPLAGELNCLISC
jgi:hypothetical protein